MPAYFSIDISIEKERIYEGIYADYIDILDKNGIRFSSGYWDYMDESLESVIRWNEEKIREDYDFPVNELYSNDYKQILLEYKHFSEVRTYIINDKDSDEIVFSIIIPEDELLTMKNGRVTFNEIVMEDIKQLVLNLWTWPCVGAIQTALDLSDGRTSIKKLREGASPSVEPFAIIPKEYFENGSKYRVHDVERDGALLEQ